MKKKQYICLLIAFLLGVLIKFFMPAVNGLTPEGVTLLSVFLPTVFMWVTVGSGWPTFLSLGVAALLQVDSGVSIFMTGWGNSVNAVMIAMMLIVFVLSDSGAMQYIAEWILSIRIVRGRPYVFYFLLCVAITVFGTVVYPMVMCVMFLELMERISLSIGYTKKDKFYKASCLIILWMTTIMDAVWPFAKPCAAFVMNFMGGLGYEINIVDWMKVSLPFAALSAITTLAVIKFLYRPDVSNFKNYDDAAIRARLKETPITRSGKVSIFCILAVIFCWVAPNLPVFGAFGAYLGAIGVPTSACVAVGILCFLKGENGEPMIDLGKSLSRMNWLLVVFIGGVMFYSGQLGQEKFGIVTMLRNVLSPVTDAMPMALVLAAGLFAAMFFTQFMSNTVSATIGVSVFMPVFLGYTNAITPALVVTFAILIGCVANSAYATYGGAAGTAICMNDNEIPFKEATPFNVSMIALTYVLTTAALLPLMASII